MEKERKRQTCGKPNEKENNNRMKPVNALVRMEHIALFGRVSRVWAPSSHIKPSLLFANRGDSCEFDRRFFHSTGLWFALCSSASLSPLLALALLPCAPVELACGPSRVSLRQANAVAVCVRCSGSERGISGRQREITVETREEKDARTNDRTSTKCAGTLFLRCCTNSMTDTQL